MHYGISNLKANFKYFKKSGENDPLHLLHGINPLLAYKLKQPWRHEIPKQYMSLNLTLI